MANNYLKIGVYEGRERARWVGEIVFFNDCDGESVARAMRDAQQIQRTMHKSVESSRVRVVVWARLPGNSTEWVTTRENLAETAWLATTSPTLQ